MEKKTFLCFRNDVKGLRIFWNEIFEAFKEGYEFDDGLTSIKEVPMATNVTRVTLIKPIKSIQVDLDTDFESVEEVKEEPAEEVEIEEKVKEVSKEVIQEDETKKEVDLVQQLENLTKKKELEAFARHVGVELPEDMHHMKYKNFIKEQLEK